MKEKTLKAIIADDEKLARRELKRMLKSVKEVQVIAEAENGLEALEKIRSKCPDLVFLDIEMPGLNGIQVVEEIRKDKSDVDVIMVTAYDHYAIKAFEVNAVDYLLKPIEPNRLEESVRRATVRRRKGLSTSRQLDLLLEALHNRNKRLSLRVGNSSIIVDKCDLIFAHVDGGVVTAVTESFSGTLNCRSLDELQEILGDGFLRAHRRYLVNIDMIKEVIPYFSGTYRLRLKNKVEIPLSRSHAKELKELIDF